VLLLQCAAVVKSLEELEVDMRKVEYVVADNAAVNPKTVERLNHILKKEHPTHREIKFIRCLPHCLNLVMVAFFKVFDGMYGITSFLRHLRGFINAGGSSSRRAAAIEYGVTQSGIDFTDTRWASLIKAIMYLMAMQSLAELHRANKLLSELALDGDASEAALKAPGAPESHWSAISLMLEEATPDESDGDVGFL